MKVKEISVAQIKPYPHNPRKNEAAVEPVANSIKAFGFRVPIVLDKNGVIVAGHTRLEAAKRLGLEKVPCVVADDLTPEQVKAFRLADNKTAEMALWDVEMLADELADISDFDMQEFGFDNIGEEGPKETREDDFDEELPAEPKAKRGDIYRLGEHRLMCGDSTSAEDVARLMEGAKGKILFTSPPYSDMREYEGGKSLDVSHISKFIEAFHDFADYQCVNLGIQVRNKEIFQYWDEYIKVAHDCGMKLLAWNVWDKLNAGSVAAAKAFFPTRHEFIFVFGSNIQENNRTVEKKEKSISTKKETRLVRQKDGSMVRSSRGDISHRYKRMESVSTILCALGAERVGHPAPFPVALPSEYIQAMTNDGDVVCEPFCGGGTTLIACEQLGRKCYAMELEPKYIDLIISRWEKFTGKKAKKIS